MRLPLTRPVRNKHLRVVQTGPFGDIERDAGISLEEIRPAFDTYDRLVAAQGAVVMALENGAHNSAELIRLNTGDASDVRRALRALRDQGIITVSERDGRAMYALTDDCA